MRRAVIAVLVFNNYRNLPPYKGAPDGRPVAGMLKYIGFKAQAPAAPVVAHNPAR